jgi:hypothetical protein
MSNDHEPEVTPIPPHFHQCRSYMGAIVTISMLIACLFAANLYTLDRLNSAREDERDLHSSFGKQIMDVRLQNRELLLEYTLLKDSHARQIAQLRSELDSAAKQLGASSGQVLDRARSMVGALQKVQSRQTDELQQQIVQKADAQDVAGIEGNLSSAESQIGTTQRTLGEVEQDLGVTRSQLGELAANSDEQRKALEELTGGEFHEFTLMRNHPINVEQIGLKLRKTNAHSQVFSLDLVVNDQEIHNREHSVFEPILLYPNGERIPYEIVITSVGSDNVAGYVRVPKTSGRPDSLTPRS